MVRSSPQPGAPPQAAPDAADREIVISRVIDAPPEAVWRAWTDPRQITRWWGPDGFSTTTHQQDVRPGGVWRFTMHGPDGRDYRNRVVFIEVAEPHRLVYRHAGEGDDEGVSFHTTVTFAGQDGMTRLTLRMVFNSPAERERVCREYGAMEGGLQTVARLADHLAVATSRGRPALLLALPSEREIILRRTYDAPRTLVFEALTRPEHVRRWWGCGESALTVCEMDVRPGGNWRIVLRGPDGQAHPFRGEFLQIDPPRRVVQTFIYDVEGLRDLPSTETLTLEERDGRTVLTTTVLHLSQQARDGHLASGMEVGAKASLDRLADLIATMSPAVSA